jgi:excisionase family DNA binding protein
MKLLTLREAAQRLRVSVVTVRRRIRGGMLRAFRSGRILRVREQDLEAMMTRRESVGWGNLSADSFVRDWDNPYDAVYDGWRVRAKAKG